MWVSAKSLNRMISTLGKHKLGIGMIVGIAKTNGYKVIEDEKGFPIQIIDPKQEEVALPPNEVGANGCTDELPVEPHKKLDEAEPEITSEPTPEETEEGTDEFFLEDPLLEDQLTQKDSTTSDQKPDVDSLNKLLLLADINKVFLDWIEGNALKYGFIIYRDKETGRPLKIFDPEDLGDEEF